MIYRWYFWLGWAALAFVLANTLPVSRLAIHPISATVTTGGAVVVYRDFPGDLLGLPRPRISYIEAVAPLTPGHNGGHWCQMRAGPVQYSSAAPVGVWSIAGWAGRCLDDPAGFVWTACWTWHLGAWRAGATCLPLTVLRNGASQ